MSTYIRLVIHLLKVSAQRCMHYASFSMQHVKFFANKETNVKTYALVKKIKNKKVPLTRISSHYQESAEQGTQEILPIG